MRADEVNDAAVPIHQVSILKCGKVMGPATKAKKPIEMSSTLNSWLKEILLSVNDQDACTQYEVCQGQAAYSIENEVTKGPK